MKWYEGKNSQEIYDELFYVSSKAIGELKFHKDSEKSELYYDEFSRMMNEVIPAIIDTKAEFWMSRNDNDVFDTWDKLHMDILELNAHMISEILKYS